MIDLPPDSALAADTPRLRLVPTTAADAEEMFALLNDQRLHAHVGGLPLGLAELAERYRGLEGHRTPDGKQVNLTWTVRLVPLGEAIGEIRAVLDDTGLATIAFVVGARYQNHGFATEACRAMVRLLEAHLFATRLEAAIPPGHGAAEKVAGRLALAPSGAAANGWTSWTGLTSAALALASAAEVTAPPVQPTPAVRAAVTPRRRTAARAR